MRGYTVLLEYDDVTQSYSVRVPALHGCYSQGETVEVALANAREAIHGHISALEQLGVSAPDERPEVSRKALATVITAGEQRRVLLGRVAA